MKKIYVCLLTALIVLLCSPASIVYATYTCDWPACESDPMCTGRCFPPGPMCIWPTCEYDPTCIGQCFPPTTISTTILTTSSTTTSIATTSSSSSTTSASSTTTTSIAALTSLNEGFEGATFPPADWSSQNILGTNVWSRTTSQFHAGAAGAFINYQQTSSPSGPVTPHYLFTPPGGEDWLITPRISISAGQELKFWVKPSQPYGATLDIRVSTTDTAVASFTASLEVIDISTSTASWKEYTCSLSSYASQNIYIAFKHKNTETLGPTTELPDQQDTDAPVAITGPAPIALNLDDVTVNAPSSTTTTSIESTTTTVEPTTTTVEPTTTTSEPTTTTTIDCSSITVTSNADSGAGSLRQAISDACANATITFDASMKGQTITLASPLPMINNNLTIDGAEDNITISGANTVSLFSSVNNGVSFNLKGLTLTKGYSMEVSCMYNNGTVTVTNCTISGNSADTAGVIYNNGTVTVTNSTLSGNSAETAGAIYNNGTLTVTNCTMSGNSASAAGVIYNNGTLTVTNCTLSGNSARMVAGAIYNNGPMTVTNSTLSGNSARMTAGCIYSNDTLTVTNSTISGNSAEVAGAIYNNGPMTVTNSTLSGNSAREIAGCIYNNNTLTVTNSILAKGASGGICFNSTAITNGGHNLVDDDTCGAGFTNSSSILLGSLGDYGGYNQTIPLLPGSAAIDDGDNATCEATDQRGKSRVGVCDIGAFESQGFTLKKSGGDSQSAEINASFTTALGMTVTADNASEPVDGGKVTFTPPGSGASAAITTSPATIASGAASVTATANGTAGGPYTVTASASGATSVDFSLTNVDTDSTTTTSEPTTTTVEPTTTVAPTTTTVEPTTTTVEPTTTTSEPSSTTTSIAALTSLNEGFEGVDFPPADWSSQNIKGSYVWSRTTSQFHAGSASAFINSQEVNSPGGLMASQINTPPSGGEDWLITPLLSISAGQELKFWIKPSPSYGAALDIRVSTTDAALASFTDSLEVIDISSSSAIWNDISASTPTWKEYTYSLRSYDGENIYIAFKHTVTQTSGPTTELQDQQNADSPVAITGSVSSAIHLDDVTVNAPGSTTTTSIESTTTTSEPSTTTVEPTTTTPAGDNTTTTTVAPSTTTVEPATTTTTVCIEHTYYRDADNDNYGNADNATVACEPPDGYVDSGTGFDCNDENPAVHPAAMEVCNGIDDDCNDAVDDAQACDAPECSVQVYPRPYIKSLMDITPNMIPFVIVAPEDSGVVFQQPFDIDWGTQYLDDYFRFQYGNRFIVGLLYMHSILLNTGEFKVTVRFGPDDTVCAGSVLVW